MRDRTLAVLKALADRNRLALYRHLAARRRPCTVGGIVGRFPVRQPTISHHLRVLREAGLVTVDRHGTRAWYGAAPGGLGPLRDLLRAARRR